MTSTTLLVHAAVVLGVAASAWVVTRRFGRSELGHLLWCVALLGLLVPPLFEVPVLPAAPRMPVEVELPAAPFDAGALPTAPFEDVAPPPVAESWQVSPLDALAFVWWMGAVAMACATVLGALAFRRRLGRGEPAAADLRSKVRAVADELGLRGVPQVRVLDEALSPAIFPLPATLVLPRALLDELSAAELRAVLLHELTHYARRDHWTRLLEAVVLAVWWWLPLAWWFRAELRFAEEASCDQRVLRQLGADAPATYAEALIKTVALLARGTGPTLPRLATGAGGARSMTWRIQMIMSDRPMAPLSIWTRAACLVGSAALLPLAPIPARVDSLVDAAVVDALAVQDPGRGTQPQPGDQPPIDLEAVQDPQDPKASAERNLLRTAVDLLQNERYIELLELLQPPATARASTAQLDQVRAMAYLQLDRLDEATEVLEAAITRFPEDARAWRSLGSIHLKRGEHARAARALRRAVVLEPDGGSAWGQLGLALQSQGDVEAAQAALVKASELEPTATQWQGLLLQTHLTQNDYASAQSVLERILKLDPADRSMRRTLIKVLVAQGRYQEAADAQRALDALVDPLAAQEREGTASPELLPVDAARSRQELRLAVTSQGEVIYAGRRIAAGSVSALVRRLCKSQPDQELEVLIQADRALTAGLLVEIVDACNDGGASKVTLSTSSPDALPAPPAPPSDEEPSPRRDGEDGPPRAVSLPAPLMTDALRALGPGRAVVLFVVNEEGLVRGAKVESSTDPAFSKPALDAVLKWRFEPGRRDGKPARFRVRMPVTFGAEAAAPKETRPRAIHQPAPVLPVAARRKTPGRVDVALVVDERGRVRAVKVESSTDPVFQKPVLDAVQKWRFEPATRDGEPVTAEMRMPIIFPAARGGR